MHAPVRSRFTTTDRDEGEALVAAAYVGNRLTVSGNVAEFRMTQERLDIGEVTFDGYHSTLRHDFDVEPLPRLAVIRMIERTVEIESASQSVTVYPGDVKLVTLPGERHHTRVDGARVESVSLAFGLLDRVCDEPGAATTRQFRTQPVEATAAHQWQRTVDHLTGSVLATGAAVTPLILGAAGQLLAATFLAVFDPAAAEARSGDGRDATPASVRRAVAYIEANPDLDLSVADIARAGRISVRGLQLGFRRHLDTTPMRHLRRVRLRAVREELRGAADGDRTVTQIAARWGFHNPGRFAADYRAEFGEVPSAVLRQAAGRRPAAPDDPHQHDAERDREAG